MRLTYDDNQQCFYYVQQSVYPANTHELPNGSNLIKQEQASKQSMIKDKAFLLSMELSWLDTGTHFSQMD